MMEAQRELYGFINKKATALIDLEIGGGNGLQGMILGASTLMNIPTFDGAFMGRAYPTKWQFTPVALEENRTVFLPSVMCDGNGNCMVSDTLQSCIYSTRKLTISEIMTKATSDLMVERVFRAGLSQLGSAVGCAEGPISGGKLMFFTTCWLLVRVC